MVQSNGTNNIGRDLYTIPLNFNNGLVPECAQLMLWSGIQWVKVILCKKRDLCCSNAATTTWAVTM